MTTTIVVVEDDPHIAMLLHELLTDAGYAVRVFHDGISALAAILARPPALVLLDLNLPSMAGEEVLMRIRRQRGPALPIVIMTASTQRRNWEAQGAMAFLAKPFDTDALLLCIARYAVEANHP